MLRLALEVESLHALRLERRNSTAGYSAFESPLGPLPRELIASGF